MNETELIALLRQGDEKAFDYLVQNHQVRVYNVCLGLLGNAEDAEDTAQEVFVEVFRSVSGFKAESKLSTWIYRIATSKSLDLMRSRKRKKRFAFISSLYGAGSNTPRMEHPDFIHPGIQLENKEMAGHLLKAIEQLPENQKVAFTLHKIEGLSYQETGEVMETSLSSVESLLLRAKQNIKNIQAD